MAERILFVYNPTSGKTTIRQRLTEIIRIFTEAGYDVLAHPTLAKGDAARTIARLHKEADIVVCCGGDGTLDEVVSAIMKHDPEKRLGYIPGGSTNDFAHSLNIPRDMARAAENIVEGKVFYCDVGAFNQEYFVYVAAFGAFTKIAYETDQNLKNTFGHVAYLAQAGPEMFHIPRFHVTGEVDQNKISGDYSYGMITNAKFVGGMRNLTGPNVDMADGLFEMTLVRTPANPLELSEIFTTLLSRNLKSPLVEVYKGSNIVLRMNEKVDWTLDGEYGGSHKRVQIRNEHQALRILRKI